MSISTHEFAVGPHTLEVLGAFYDRYRGVFPMVVHGEWLFCKLARFRPRMEMSIQIGRVSKFIRSALGVFFNAIPNTTFISAEDGCVLRIAEGDEIFTVRIIARDEIVPNMYTTMEGACASLHGILAWNRADEPRPVVHVTASQLTKTSLQRRTVYGNIDPGTAVSKEIEQMCHEAGYAYSARVFKSAPINFHSFYKSAFEAEEQHTDTSDAARNVAAVFSGYYEIIKRSGNSPTAANDFMTLLTPAEQRFLCERVSAYMKQSRERKKRPRNGL